MVIKSHNSTDGQYNVKKGKKAKGQPKVNKITHRKSKIEQHLKNGVNNNNNNNNNNNFLNLKWITLISTKTSSYCSPEIKTVSVV